MSNPQWLSPSLTIPVLTLSLLGLGACGGGDGNGESPTQNQALTVSAGTDQTVNELTEVTLGADADGAKVDYTWSQTSGPTVSLSGADSDTASFSAPDVDGDESCTFEVTVTNESGATATDEVTVLIRNVPVVDAGVDQVVAEGGEVTLTASADGNIVGYDWSQTSCPTVSLSGADSDTASFTAPDVDADENCTFEVTVTGDNGTTATDEVTVLIQHVNQPPVVDAGADQAVDEGSAVSLGGSADDADGSIASTSWSQTQGAPVALANANALATTFTAPELDVLDTLIFELTALDNEGAGASDSLSITVVPVVTATGKLNDTGITDCGDYAFGGGSGNHGNSENCDQDTDADGDPIPAGQDGDDGRDVTHNDDSDGHAGFSFVKLDTGGDPLPASATDWSCVQDLVTGLIWEVKTTDGGLHDADNTYTWYNPDSTANGGAAGTQSGGSCTGSECDTRAYVQAVNAQGLCGFSDWRIPLAEELQSLVDYSISFPDSTIDAGYFPNTRVNRYWSASPSAANDSSAWAVSFDLGDVNGGSSKADGNSVRLVSAEQ